MKVDIWSDIRCPFCYIGKRKFEAALEQFPQKEHVEVTWHSFQLDPGLTSQPGKDVYEYLAERKGQTRQWSVQVHGQLAESAKEVGLTFNFDKAIIANSFDAQRLIQLAKQDGSGDAAEEKLFKAYFTEGKDISDPATLIGIGSEIGLNATAVKEMLLSDEFELQVRQDEKQAQALGVRGVPFFVINEQYGISGAQSPETFLQAMQKAWKDYEQQNPLASATNAGDNSCSIDGNC